MRAGFTLMELLLVMAIIAILGSIIMGSVTYISRVSRKRRAEVTCRVLETALSRYRSDCNKWPYGSLKPKKNASSGKEEVTATGKGNAEVFGALREDKNSDKIRYLDETTVFTLDNDGQPIPLSRAGAGEKPLIYISRDTATPKYFKVVINLDDDTVAVTADELNQ